MLLILSAVFMFRILVVRAEQFRMLSPSLTKGLVQELLKSYGFSHSSMLLLYSTIPLKNCHGISSRAQRWVVGQQFILLNPRERHH